MPNLKSIVDQVICRAYSFDEVLFAHADSETHHNPLTELGSKRLDAWCQSSAGGNWDTFTKRLARDGWKIEEMMVAQNLLCGPRMPFGFGKH